ncbi:hypothetical protein GCM10009574_028740 [Streptomyces asiaticus]
MTDPQTSVADTPPRGSTAPVSAPQRPEAAQDPQTTQRAADGHTGPPPTVTCQWCGTPIPRHTATWWDDQPQCRDPFACARRVCP